MIREVYVSEETVALAKQKACEMLNTSEKNVDFKVIQFPSKKILGMFGGKMAQVKASIKMSTAERAKECIKEILFYMGLGSLDVEILEDANESCKLKINGKDVRYIVGKRGATLDSLEYIVGLIVNDGCGDNYCMVKLEASDYRDRRKQALLDLGTKISYSVLSKKKPIVLEPMKAFDRKLIHAAVSKIEGVKSMSKGEGNKRRVVISPVG